ncbi:MAG: CDP-alcohol phosphatidyltransferase family protein [Bacteroidia bacterium]|nr:CDP-alcohol phosphatidyltransferase family protein [Bacteroidia bacterium]
MKKHIPNLVTLLNLLSGCIAVVFAMNGELHIAAFFVLLGILFDYLDGFLAKILDARSELGLHLDSLADVVTSGLVPGIVMFKLLKLSGPDWSISESVKTGFDFSMDSIIPFFGLFIVLAAAYRLAKFNVSTDQTNHFYGIPTPANALLIISFPLILEYQNNDLMNGLILNRWFLLGITLASCILMNARLKMLAMKFSNWSFKDNAARYMLIVLAIVLLSIFQFSAIPLIILAYIVISLLNR